MRDRDPMDNALIFVVISLVTLFVLVITLVYGAEAATYYLSPSGSNSNSGTTDAAPWGTFGHALPRLQAGDTLVLLDGIYTKDTTGLPYVNCGGKAFPSVKGLAAIGVHRGTAAAPITIKAKNERKAHLQGAGNNVLQLDNCTYWTIEGLYISNVDVQVSGYEGSTIVTNQGEGIVVRRNLVYGPNAWFNSHGIALYGTAHTTVEENEVYYFTRHGILLGTGGGQSNNGATVRRNYLHSRDHDSMPGGYTCPGSCANHRGDEGISYYPAHDLVVENNIVEDVGGAFTGQCKNNCVNNRYYGNIVINAGGMSAGARSESYPNTPQQMPTDGIYEHNLIYHADGWYALGCRVCKHMQWRNNSIIQSVPYGGEQLGFLADASCGTSCGEGGDGQLSSYVTNLLVVSPNGLATKIAGQSAWSVQYLRAYQTQGGSPALSDSHYSHVTTNDPALGSCLVYIPSTSNLKGAGEGGSDIGASILYRYQDGVLTNMPLWDPTTGRFPCGAVVPGVNDVAGKSCRDVHERLHVGAAFGCPLPYAASGPSAVLTWQPPTEGGEVEHYEVMREQTVLATLPASQLTYTDTSATAQSCYTVSARNGAGESSTEPVCVDVHQEPPGPPQGLNVQPVEERR
jgi:hypothetical protein